MSELRKEAVEYLAAKYPCLDFDEPNEPEQSAVEDYLHAHARGVDAALEVVTGWAALQPPDTDVHELTERLWKRKGAA